MYSPKYLNRGVSGGIIPQLSVPCEPNLQGELRGQAGYSRQIQIQNGTRPPTAMKAARLSVMASQSSLVVPAVRKSSVRASASSSIRVGTRGSGAVTSSLLSNTSRTLPNWSAVR